MLFIMGFYMNIKLTDLNTLKAISINFNTSLKFLEYMHEQSKRKSKLQKMEKS